MFKSFKLVTEHELDALSCLMCALQVLGWQQTAAKIGMQRCAASSQWLNERISLARYAHVTSFSSFKFFIFKSVDMNLTVQIIFLQVPLGNFELDWLIFTADIFFSRALHDQQQVFYFYFFYLQVCCFILSMLNPCWLKEFC